MNQVVSQWRTGPMTFFKTVLSMIKIKLAKENLENMGLDVEKNIALVILIGVHHMHPA